MKVHAEPDRCTRPSLRAEMRHFRDVFDALGHAIAEGCVMCWAVHRGL